MRPLSCPPGRAMVEEQLATAAAECPMSDEEYTYTPSAAEQKRWDEEGAMRIELAARLDRSARIESALEKKGVKVDDIPGCIEKENLLEGLCIRLWKVKDVNEWNACGEVAYYMKHVPPPKPEPVDPPPGTAATEAPRPSAAAASSASALPDPQ